MRQVWHPKCQLRCRIMMQGCGKQGTDKSCSFPSSSTVQGGVKRPTTGVQSLCSLLHSMETNAPFPGVSTVLLPDLSPCPHPALSAYEEVLCMDSIFFWRDWSLNSGLYTCKTSALARHQWFISVILATQEAEIRRITV
jgi:hypothetical protein